MIEHSDQQFTEEQEDNKLTEQLVFSNNLVQGNKMSGIMKEHFGNQPASESESLNNSNKKNAIKEEAKK